MKRTQIQLDERTFEALRYRAFQEKRSMASVIRNILQVRTLPKAEKKGYRVDSFAFVASGGSNGKGSGSIAKKHDEEFVNASSL